MTFDQMMPVLLSTPTDLHTPTVLPFKFTGGFGLSTKQVGLILSMQGLYSMTAQFFLFPFVVRRLGPLGTFRLIAFSFPFLYLVTPYLVLLPDVLRMPGVYALLVVKITMAVLAYPANAILLTNSAPSNLVLGTINGVAASTASLSRAFGPTVSGILYTTGLKIGYSGLPWWCSALVTIIGATISLWQKEEGGRMDTEDEPEEGRVGVVDPMACETLDDGALAAEFALVTGTGVEVMHEDDGEKC